MSGISLDYQISDADVRVVFSRLTKLERAAVMDEIGMEWHSLTMDRFLTSTAPDGTPWEPSLRAQREGGKTLVDRAHLRDSFTHEISGSADALAYGSNMIYAAIHQSGGKAGRNYSVELPPRPILPDDDTMSPEYSEVIGDALHERLMELMRA